MEFNDLTERECIFYKLDMKNVRFFFFSLKLQTSREMMLVEKYSAPLLPLESLISELISVTSIQTSCD